MAKEIITAEALRKLFSYDDITGLFTRLVRTSNCVNVGDVAGGKGNDGYIKMRVCGRMYKAHRLAWLYVHGEWPAGDIDHIDGDPGNNAIANLRDVTTSVNMQNQKRARTDSAHGFMGVTPEGARWTARIMTTGKSRYLGSFDSPELAHAAYLEAKRELHEGCTI